MNSNFEINIDNKVQLNLTDYAWMIIDEDRSTFSQSEDRISLSGFLNEILEHSLFDSDASVDKKSNGWKSNLLHLVEDAPFKSLPCSLSDIKRCIDFLGNLKKKDWLERYAHDFPKGEGRKFRINQANMDYIYDNCIEAQNYKGRLSLYLKYIFELYARKAPYERERIYFHAVFEVLSRCKTELKKAHFRIQAGSSWHAKIYDIIPDQHQNYNYVICQTKPSSKDDEVESEFENIKTIRLSKICSAKALQSSGKIPERDMRKIKAALKRGGPQFIGFFTDEIDIVVYLTDKGIKRFKEQALLRPVATSIETDGHTYHFNCSLSQAKIYFQRLIPDATILSPEHLKHQMISLLKKGLNSYEAKN